MTAERLIEIANLCENFRDTRKEGGELHKLASELVDLLESLRLANLKETTLLDVIDQMGRAAGIATSSMNFIDVKGGVLAKLARDKADLINCPNCHRERERRARAEDELRILTGKSNVFLRDLSLMLENAQGTTKRAADYLTRDKDRPNET